MKFPETLLEFQEQFPNEAACWKALRRVRWPHGFECPRCGHRKSYPIAGRRLEQCQSCRYQASVTAGTIFHKTRVPLRIWFLGIFFVARHKQGSRRCSSSATRAWAVTRRPGPCCTRFARLCGTARSTACGAGSRPTRPTWDQSGNGDFGAVARSVCQRPSRSASSMPSLARSTTVSQEIGGVCSRKANITTTVAATVAAQAAAVQSHLRRRVRVPSASSAACAAG